jgi:hypothetical protein
VLLGSLCFEAHLRCLHYDYAVRRDAVFMCCAIQNALKSLASRWCGV